ncbi:uncharacterized protein J3D65DRAFT_165879 [Phyllosticta citribraziliensis]|uniref:Uncharacterized protein n=1 Tax=Phyllosticta citribraziliensis TaxID=989973 RepID=A0ABR1L2G5_9PEZI
MVPWRRDGAHSRPTSISRREAGNQSSRSDPQPPSISQTSGSRATRDQTRGGYLWWRVDSALCMTDASARSKQSAARFLRLSKRLRHVHDRQRWLMMALFASTAADSGKSTAWKIAISRGVGRGAGRGVQMNRKGRRDVLCFVDSDDHEARRVLEWTHMSVVICLRWERQRRCSAGGGTAVPVYMSEAKGRDAVTVLFDVDVEKRMVEREQRQAEAGRSSSFEVRRHDHGDPWDVDWSMYRQVCR